MKTPMIVWVCVASLCVATTAVQTADAVEVQLETVSGAKIRAYGRQYLTLDDKGEGSLPFATSCGALKMRLVDGALLLDCNGDGTLNEADGKPIQNGKTAEVAVRLFGAPATYPMTVGIYSGQRVRLQSQVVVKGEKEGVSYELHDRNLNGRFDEYGTDTLRVKGRTETLAKVVRLDQKLQNVIVAEDGKTLTLSPYAGPLANVALSCAEEGWVPELYVKHKDGVYFGQVALGMPIPPGQYGIYRARLNSAGAGTDSAKQPKMSLYGYDGEAQTELTLKEGDSTVKVGLPLKLAAKAVKLEDDASKVKIVSADLVGVAGEKYRAQVRGTGVTSTLECWVRAGGKELMLSSMGYG